MEKKNISVLAITKNGIAIGGRLKESFPEYTIWAPSKLEDQTAKWITWYGESTTEKIGKLFNESHGVVCIFSLGAVIRLIAPHMKGKKIDPAVIVIDDKANFVISTLSGHIGGANTLTEEIAQVMGATPVVTTAADVNKTISVDLVGRDKGWKIEDDSTAATVTRVSAAMVNKESIGVFQEAGSPKGWYDKLPSNVTIYNTLEEICRSNVKARMIISDRIIVTTENAPVVDTVVYRPPTLTVGVGVHWDTPAEKIVKSIIQTLDIFGYSTYAIAQIASIKKPQDVKGLKEAASKLRVPLVYINREDLAKIQTPNPSVIVKRFEGTASVSEAAAITVSSVQGDSKLIVEKQKFPPDLTVAVARRID